MNELKIYIIMKAKGGFNGFMSEFGFESGGDFLNSCFQNTIAYKPLILGVSVAACSSCFEKFIGIEPIVYLAFVLLLVLEFVTGIKASIREGKKIESKRFGRVILKILTYTIIIGIINIFKTRLEIPVLFGSTINIYAWLYYAVLNLILLQLLISVFENLARLGYKESSRIFRYLTSKSYKWFKLDEKEKEKK